MAEETSNASGGTDKNDVMGQLQLSSLDGKSAYLDEILQHFKNDKFSDTVLVVGGKRYPAHKLKLAALTGGNWQK